MLTDPLLRGAIDERTIAAMRLMLALLALLSTYIDPAETTLHLHSRTNKDKPLVGYEVLVQSEKKSKDPKEALERLGATGRDGKLPVPPGNSPVRILFLRNGGQLLARFRRE